MCTNFLVLISTALAFGYYQVEDDGLEPPFIRSGVINDITDSAEEMLYIPHESLLAMRLKQGDISIRFGKSVRTDVPETEDGYRILQNTDSQSSIRVHFGKEVNQGTDDLDSALPNITNFFRNLAMNNYDSRLRPNYSAKPTKVTCSMYVTSISSISEVNMDYTIDFYFRQTWTDYRLRWKSKMPEFDAEEAITISGEYFTELWRPDTFFVNEKAASFHRVTGMNSFIRIRPDGTLTQSIRLTIKAGCFMQFRFFPLDHQRCPLYIESFSMPFSDILYNWARLPEDDGGPNKNAVAFATDSTSQLHFLIYGFRTVETVHEREDGYNRSQLLFEIFLQRNLGYYLLQVYVPAFLIVVISWISFWIPRQSAPARVWLGVTTFLTMVTFTSLGATAGLPHISYLKAMDIYLLTSFLFVFIALIEYAVVSYAEKRAVKSSVLSLLVGSTILGSENRSNMAIRIPTNSRSSNLNSVFTTPKQRSRSQSINMVTDDNNMTCECSAARSLPSRIEWVSRFGFPLSFVLFNISYWAYYLQKLSNQDSSEVEGYVKFG